MSDESAALVRPAGGASVTERVRGNYDPAQVAAIRNTVAKECNDAELAMFLEVSARYELDPFMREIWAAKIDGRLQIFVGHQGLLSLADRKSDYRGFRSDVVRENDHFKVTNCADGDVKVEHSYEQGGEKDRGSIVGAWCVARREGRDPSYFFARWDEYAKGGKTPWAKYGSAMILKCAEAVAHKKLYSLSGLYIEEEFSRVERGDPANLTAVSEPDYGDDPQQAARIRQLFDLLDYLPRKRVMKLAGPVGVGLDENGRDALIVELMAEAREAGVEIPPLPETVDADAEEVTDADVVPDDGERHTEEGSDHETEAAESPA